MEVKKLIQQNQQKKIRVEDLVSDYYLNAEENSENSAMRYLKNTSSLNELQEHSESGIIDGLNKRIGYGVPYAFIGKDLLSIRCDFPGFWYFNKRIKADLLRNRPHPYGISLNTYLKMKETQENQVIAVVGASGTGKTFNAIHILDHLISISTEEYILEVTPSKFHLFEALHRSVQILHIMGSVMKKHNSESTSCAFDISVNFDREFRSVSGKIHASLLDVTLPTNKKGRTYQLLHSIMYSDKNTLKSLGIIPTLSYKIFQGSKQTEDLKILDIEINQRFFECLNSIGVTTAEKKSFLELLSCVIHLYEIEFVSKKNSMDMRNKSVIKKICKLLGLQDAYFNEKFGIFTNKKECEDRAKDLARHLYSKAFEWLNHKINSYLEETMKTITEARLQMLSSLNSFSRDQSDSLKPSLHPLYTITILDFPGFTREKSLSGISINLAFETLNYYTCTSYIKLQKQLSSQNIILQNMPECKAKVTVETFMRNDLSFMHSMTLPEPEHRRFRQVLESYSSKDLSKIMSLAPTNNLFISYSWGDVEYNFSQLREESLRHFYEDFNSQFLKASSSLVLCALTQPPTLKTLRLQANFEEAYTASLRKILMPHLGINPVVVYCIKSDFKGMSREAVVGVRSSQIIPNLVWHWFGYPHWIKISDLAAELGLKAKDCTPERLKQELQRRFGWKDFEVTRNYALLKNYHMKEFKELINKKFRTPDQSISDLSMSLSLFSLSPDKDFSLVIHEEGSVMEKSMDSGMDQTVISNTFKHIDIGEYFAGSADVSTREQSIVSNKKSSLQNGRNSIIVIHPKKYNITEIQRHIDYHSVNYASCIGNIATIQRMWRGFTARQYTGALTKLNRSATCIQKVWKGFNLRKQIKPLMLMQISAVKIQKVWKKRMEKKNSAARKIQNWYIRLKFKQEHKLGVSSREMESNSSFKRVAKKIIKKNVKQQSRKLKKDMNNKSKNYRASSRSSSTYSQEDNRSFSPVISERSKILWKNRASKFNNLSLADRFKVLEANRQEMIHKKRQAKLEEETYTHVPRVNPDGFDIKNTFYERQNGYMKSYKIHHEEKARPANLEECSFRPSINKSLTSRNPEKTVQDLYSWARIKEKKINQARDAKEETEMDKIVNFKLSENTLNYSFKRKKKLSEEKSVSNQIKRESSPYWPNN